MCPAAGWSWWIWIISFCSSSLSGTYISPKMYINSSLIIHSPKGTFGCCLSPCFNAMVISLWSLSDVNNWRILVLLHIAVLNKIGWDWNFSLGISAWTGCACSSPSLGKSPDLLVRASALPIRIIGWNEISKFYWDRVPAHRACRWLSRALVLNVIKLC